MNTTSKAKITGLATGAYLFLAILSFSATLATASGFFIAANTHEGYMTYIGLTVLFFFSIAVLFFSLAKFGDAQDIAQNEKAAYIESLPLQKYELTALRVSSNLVGGDTSIVYTVSYNDITERLRECTVVYDINLGESSYISFKKDDKERYDVELHLPLKSM